MTTSRLEGSPRPGSEGRTSVLGRSADIDGVTAGPERVRGPILALWILVATFAVVTLVRSSHVGIPLRDPDGMMLRDKLQTTGWLLLIVVPLDLLVRTARAGRASWSLRGLGQQLRARWTPVRIAAVLTGLIAYHAVYFCYRNLKSWDVFNEPHDGGLLALDRAVFLGHQPGRLLQDVLGTGAAADVLGFTYHVFTLGVPVALVVAMVTVPEVRRAYVFLCAAVWTWILGTLSYYVIPSLGPFASAPGSFSDLRSSEVGVAQHQLLVDRAHLLTDPGAHDAFASISAFASLHVGFTCMVLLVARHYRWRRTSWVLGAYLAGVVVSTIYFGYHFVIDDVAGVLMALCAVALGRWMASLGSDAPSGPHETGTVG